VAVWQKSSGFEVLREPFLAADREKLVTVVYGSAIKTATALIAP
jgi:hypothetical protein